MGQANVNLGGIGVDWGPDGGGATFMGVRVGGSGERGFQVGPNLGVGVTVNGVGAGVEARADVGLGASGFSAGAGANATFGASRADVQVLAKQLSEAEKVLDLKLAAMTKCKHALDEAKNDLKRASDKVLTKKNLVEQKKADKKHLEKLKQNASDLKVEMTTLKDEAELECSRRQLSVEEYRRKMKRAMRKDDSSMALQLQSQVRNAEEIIPFLQHKVQQYATQEVTHHNKLIELQNLIVDEAKELKKLEKLEEQALDEKAGCEGKVNAAKELLEQAQRDVDRLKRELGR